MKRIDMSEKAVLKRLRSVDRLRELCLTLVKAKKITSEKPKEQNKRDDFSEQK